MVHREAGIGRPWDPSRHPYGDLSRRSFRDVAPRTCNDFCQHGRNSNLQWIVNEALLDEKIRLFRYSQRNSGG